MSASTDKGRRMVQRILDAAERVVAQQGHAGATTRAIAAAAGVDKRVLSYYFESREALLAEVVSRTVARVAQSIAADLQALTTGRRDPRAALEVVWRRIVSEPALVRAYISILGTDVEAGQMAAAIAHMNIETTELICAALVALGDSDERARRRAAVVTVAIRGLLLAWAEGGPATLIDDTLTLVADACRVG